MNYHWLAWVAHLLCVSCGGDIVAFCAVLVLSESALQSLFLTTLFGQRVIFGCERNPAWLLKHIRCPAQATPLRYIWQQSSNSLLAVWCLRLTEMFSVNGESGPKVNTQWCLWPLVDVQKRLPAPSWNACCGQLVWLWWQSG